MSDTPSPQTTRRTERDDFLTEVRSHARSWLRDKILETEPTSYAVERLTTVIVELCDDEAKRIYPDA